MPATLPAEQDIASTLFQDSSGQLTPEGKRNFNLGVINGVMHFFAETLLDPTLVLASFLSYLNASPILIGLLLPFRDGTWYLPQLFVSGYVQTLPRKIVHYRSLSYVRTAGYLATALAILFIQDRTLLLWAFFISFLISSIAAGLCGLSFLETVSKTIPARRRGEFFSYRLGLGSLLGIGASFIVKWLLDPASPLPFPDNIGVLALAFAVFAGGALFLYNGVTEPADTNLKPPAPLKVQVDRAMHYLRNDPDYRRFMFLQSSLMVASMATPFFAVHVQREMGGDPGMVGIYLGFLTASTLAANFLFGRMSYQRGNRLVMILAVAAGIAMTLIVLGVALLAHPLGISGSLASSLLIPVFILNGVRAAGQGVSSNSLLLGIAPPQDRSLYIGFTNSFQGLVFMLTSLSGVIMELMGFSALVGITLLAFLAALVAVSGIREKK